MTGLLGGGHGIYFDATTGRARNLDCFVAVPGLGAEPPGGGAPRAGRSVRHGARALRGRNRLVRRAGSSGGARRALERARPAALAAPGRACAPSRARCGPDARRARVLPADAGAGDDDERGRADLFAGRLAARRGRPPPPAGARGRAGVARRGRAARRIRGNDREGAARPDGGAWWARHRGRPHLVRGSLEGPCRARVHAATSSGRAPGCPTSPLPWRAYPSSAASRSRSARSRSSVPCSTTCRPRTGRRTSPSSTTTAMPACSRPASGSAPATSSPGSTCT